MNIAELKEKKISELAQMAKRLKIEAPFAASPPQRTLGFAATVFRKSSGGSNRSTPRCIDPDGV